MGPDGVFVAHEVLAKHDENYMPREVADALKKSGRWQEGGSMKPVATTPDTQNGDAAPAKE
jgi:cytochrome c-type biogenesis protein CcmE